MKPTLDTSILDKWPSVGGALISNDGEYACYSISTSIFQKPEESTLIIRATNNNWKTEFKGVAYHQSSFSGDSRKIYFMKPNDSLCIVTLGEFSIECIANVSSFKLSNCEFGEWLCYKLKNPERGLVIRNVMTEREFSFNSINNYFISNDGKTLVLQTEKHKEGKMIQALELVNLSNGSTKTIWEGMIVKDFVFDASCSQLAFISEEIINGSSTQFIYNYSIPNDLMQLLVDNKSPDIAPGYLINGITKFSKDGSRLFFFLKEKEYQRIKINSAKVDIWNYRDTKLQPQQLKELTPKNVLAAVIIKSEQIVRLQYDNDKIISESSDGNIMLVQEYLGSSYDYNWSVNSQPKNYLVSTKNGERIKLKNDGVISPGGKYVISYDRHERQYFAYNISTQTLVNISHLIKVPIYNDEDGRPRPAPPFGIAGWMEKDSAVFIYDRYDIWQLDPEGQKLPINITNGYGLKNKIAFRFGMMNYFKKNLFIHEKIILSAFKISTKESGFYSKIIGEKGDPQKLSIGSYCYSISNRGKAKDKDVYLVLRESSIESPNYFKTSDFKNFIPLSNCYPEKDYNWLTTELLSWQMFDGRNTLGILYKPENFDPNKKYPVIVHYYERKSDDLNKYKRPAFASDEINIPWFVSNGYLVLAPDIHYGKGEPGKSTYNSIVSGAKNLFRFPWVDSNKIGIQGHSMGGFETNYLVTHTNIFAAAMSSSGAVDFISNYGTFTNEGVHSQFLFEYHSYRLGATLWQRPDVYMKNSPILYAHKTTTPVLLMNNRGDGVVPFSQGIEFFTALRRMGKRAWMLQYDDEGHSLLNKKAQKDYTIRVTQFFDHYLKETAVPQWMLYGIPASSKGYDDGLKLITEKDKKGRWISPGFGLLTAEEQKKVDELQKRKPIIIKLDEP